MNKAYEKMIEGFKLIRESLDEMDNNGMSDEDISIDISDTPDEEQNTSSEVSISSQVIEELTRVFTPVLLMEGSQLSSDDIDILSNIVNESTLIQFSERDRMAQLQTTAVKILGKINHSHHWKSFKESSKLRSESLLALQQEYGGAADDISKQYLLRLSTTSNDDKIRQKAKQLLSV